MKSIFQKYRKFVKDKTTKGENLEWNRKREGNHIYLERGLDNIIENSIII
jgi:hypothetical protein